MPLSVPDTPFSFGPVLREQVKYLTDTATILQSLGTLRANHYE